MKFWLTFLLIISFRVSAQHADIDILRKINDSYTVAGGKTFIVITESVTPVSFGIPAGIIITSCFTKDSVTRWKGIELLGTQLLNGIVTTGMKLAISRPRPFVTYPNDIEKYTKAGSYSFPSGHTSTAFAFATSMTINYPKWYIAVPCYTYACAIGYSRMYLGVHYPSDVVCGMLVGSASAVATHYLMRWGKKKWGK